jgi:hypothetical protein
LPVPAPTPSLEGMYRDERAAALAAVAKLRDDTADLDAKLSKGINRVDEVEKRVDEMEERVGLGPAAARRRLWGALMAIAVAVVLAVEVLGAAGSRRADRMLELRSAPPYVDESSPAVRQQPFDRVAAASAFHAIDVSACARLTDRSGRGSVSVVFRPVGTVEDVTVDQTYFKNTRFGACVEDKFRDMVVPRFDGDPVEVHMGFGLDPFADVAATK